MSMSPKVVTVLLVAAGSAAVALALGGMRPASDVAAGDGADAAEEHGDDPRDDEPEEHEDGGRPDRASVEPPIAERSRALLDAEGELSQPPSAEDYACRTPDVVIPEDPACATGASYPACRWQLPEEDAAGDLYRIWRNTTPEHRWAQPGLVSLVMAVAADHAYRWPGEIVTIGDLDAPGPRHQTHDLGHDVDLYLENALMETNIGGGHYIDTYAGRPSRVVDLLRARVLDLAKNLATCSHGHLRIYYNDPEVLTPFLAWFTAQGMVSDVGPAMVEHNRLHRFHFHMTVADGLSPLPR